MRRTLFGITLALLAISAVAVATQGPFFDLENCVHVEEHDKVLCDLIDPTTTTTLGETTTTTEATTTTTVAPGLVIPPTEPYPTTGYAAGGGYDIIAGNATTGTVWWTAPYGGSNWLAIYPGQGEWIAGDREGYRCAYGFIEDSTDEIVGRFAFVRPPDQTYAKVNDKFMDEAQRYLDGTPFTGSTAEIQDEDCTDVLSPIDYAGACRDVDERPRVAFFDADGQVLDIRDYGNTDANGVVFNLHSADASRVTVIACEEGQVGVIVYYDSMGDGQLAVDMG